MNNDRIERSITINAPRSKVWRALTDAREFGTWFQVKLEGDFVAGQTVVGQTTFPGYEHVRFRADVETIAPEHRFVLRWHPYAVEPDVDYSKESKTLVEFTLEESGGATTVTVIESGFASLPAERRDEAFRMNSGGWDAQLENIRQHVLR